MLYETNEQLNYWADIYLKLQPFIRIFNGEICWQPAQDIKFAPSFEEFLKIQEVRKQNEAAMGNDLMIMSRDGVVTNSEGL